MENSPREADEGDRREATDGDPVPADDFYRGGGVVGRSDRRGPSWWPGGFDAGRPPDWLSFSLAVAGVLAGFLAFSAAWDVAGAWVMAVPLATLAGLAVGVGTVLGGGYVWARSATGPR